MADKNEDWGGGEPFSFTRGDKSDILSVLPELFGSVAVSRAMCGGAGSQSPALIVELFSLPWLVVSCPVCLSVCLSVLLPVSHTLYGRSHSCCLFVLDTICSSRWVFGDKALQRPMNSIYAPEH